jgi:hypothetical protein
MSSDESVLTVNTDGKITAKAPGVVLIRASVTYNDVTKYAEIPVAVK